MTERCLGVKSTPALMRIHSDTWLTHWAQRVFKDKCQIFYIAVSICCFSVFYITGKLLLINSYTFSKVKFKHLSIVMVQGFQLTDLVHFITSAKEVMFSVALVCLFVCPQDHLHIYILCTHSVAMFSGTTLILYYSAVLLYSLSYFRSLKGELFSQIWIYRENNEKKSTFSSSFMFFQNPWTLKTPHSKNFQAFLLLLSDITQTNKSLLKAG